MQRESNDSGTESDGELLDVENKRHLDVDMETSEYPTMIEHKLTIASACDSFFVKTSFQYGKVFEIF